MLRDKLKYIILIVVFVIIFAIVVYFSYKMIVEGKSVGQAISDAKETAMSSQEGNENQENTDETQQTSNVFDVSEFGGYIGNSISGERAKELLNKILQKYLANVVNGQKKDTSIVLVLSNNQVTDQNKLKEMKSLIQTYSYVVLGKNPVRETYRIYFEQDKNGSQKLKIIDNKDALVTMGP